VCKSMGKLMVVRALKAKMKNLSFAANLPITWLKWTNVHVQTYLWRNGEIIYAWAVFADIYRF